MRQIAVVYRGGPRDGQSTRMTVSNDHYKLIADEDEVPPPIRVSAIEWGERASDPHDGVYTCDRYTESHAGDKHSRTYIYQWSRVVLNLVRPQINERELRAKHYAECRDRFPEGSAGWKLLDESVRAALAGEDED